MLIKPQRKEKVVLVIILALLLVLRIPGLSNPPVDYHNWRQSDTEAMAQNILENNFSVMYPQLNYDGPAPNYAQLEVPVVPLLIALLYKLFGYNYLLARLVPVFFFLTSAYYLYLIGLKFLGQNCALFALVLYGIFPFNIYFSRAIMPEAATLFFQLSGFYLFVLWLERGKHLFLALSSILIALAVMQKVPAVFILVPMAYLLLRKYRWGLFLRYETWIIFFTAVLPAFLYFRYLGQLSGANYVTGIASRFFPDFIKSLTDRGTLDFLKSTLIRAFSGMGLLFFIFSPFFLNKRMLPLGVWLLSMSVETAIVMSAVQLDYYAIFLGPPLALLGGGVLGYLSRIRLRYIGLLASTVSLFIILYQGYLELIPRYTLNDNYLLYARVIAEETKKEDLLVIGLDNPVILNLSQRKGWRANINYHQDPADELKEYREQGADYFIIIDNKIYGDEDGSYKKYLDSNFDISFYKDGITLYKIN